MLLRLMHSYYHVFFIISDVSAALITWIDVDPVAIVDDAGDDMIEHVTLLLDSHESRLESYTQQQGIQQQHVIIAVPIRDTLLQDVCQKDVGSRDVLEPVGVRYVLHLVSDEGRDPGQDAGQVVVFLRITDRQR